MQWRSSLASFLLPHGVMTKGFSVLVIAENDTARIEQNSVSLPRGLVNDLSLP